jgi:hypothetical protein
VSGVDFDGKGQVLFIGHLYHARDTNKIDLGGKRESANYWGSRDDEDINIGSPQMGGDGQSPTNMPQAISVVGIHENVIGGLAGHAYFQSDIRWGSIPNNSGVFQRPTQLILKQRDFTR